MQWLPCSATIHGAAVSTARFGHSAVCISGTGSVWGTDLVVVFGGVSYSDSESALEHHAALSDVAVLQAETDTWFSPQVNPASAEGGLPDARAFHCAAAVDRRMYVFGGHVMSYDPVLNKKRRRFFNDLWCLDTDTWSWQCLSPGGPGPGPLPGAVTELPPRRDMATLTRAGASCLLLFGGRLESGRVAGDAWVLDVNTLTWTQLRMPGPTPPPRKMHAAVYVTNRVVIFGGERDAGLLDDLWTLKGVDGSEPVKWTQIKLRPAPSGRFGHAVAACGSRLAVFGGCLDHSTLLSFSRTYVQCNELWVLDMATFSWHRVEAPEGVVTFSGAALDDPHLLPLLQQQAQEPDVERPPSQQLLALPLERMCHSLVMVGAQPTATSPSAAAGGMATGSGGLLLLLGGRKREGICDDSWWLTMGPDNLTPTLTVPRPESLATALAASLEQRTAHPRAPASASPRAPGTTPGGGSTASSSPPPPLSPMAPAAALPPLAPVPGGAPALANPTLLSNLLRKSAPPAALEAVPLPPQAAAAVGASGSGAAAAGGSSLNSSTGSALDAAASSSLVPVPGAGQPHAAAAGFGSRGMPVSRSTGSIVQETGPAAAAAAASAAAAGLAVHPPTNSFTSGHQYQLQPPSPSPPPPQQHQSVGQAGPSPGAKERMADKASMAFNRLMSNLRNKDVAAALGAPQPPASPSTSPTGNGLGLIARFLDGSVGRGSTAAAAAATAVAAGQPVAQPSYGPTSIQGQAGSAGRGTVDASGGSKSAPASPSGLAASLPPEVRAPLERLRAGLGLAPLGASAASPASPSSACNDPVAALAALGRRLAAANGAATAAASDIGVSPAASTSGPSATASGAVWLARRHLATSAPERLTMGQLGLVLADCQVLLKGRAAVAWERLEREDLAARRRSDSMGGGGSGGAAPAAADSATLMWLVASRSHWLMGLRPDELRVGDVVRLMQSYGELLTEVAAASGEAGGMAG